jgi:hypothetical protein
MDSNMRALASAWLCDASFAVSLGSGQLMPTGAVLSPIEHVRFWEAFSISGKDIGDRTVFVVQASKLGEWRSKIDFVETLPSREGDIFFI